MFDTLFYEPIFNALLFIHRYVGQDMGLAIIIVTLLIKGVLYLPSLSAIRSSRQLQTLQPELKALQEKFKNDKEGLAKAQMELYKQSKVNPLSSCLPIIIQLPILFAMYRVFLNGLHGIGANGILNPDQLNHLYDGLKTFYSLTPLKTTFLHAIDLAAKHNWYLAIVAAASQFWQSKMLATPKEPKTPEAKDEALTSSMNRQMLYFFPLITLYISYTLPAGLALYWIVSTGFTIVQQYIFLRQHPLPNANPAQPT